MEEPKRNLLDEVLEGKHTNFEKLSDKVNRLINSRENQVINDHIRTPESYLEQTITYKIFDCLYDHGSLTPSEIHSVIKITNPGTISHYLERISLIGITKPVNHENLTFKDVPHKGLDILPILYEEKKWELTEYIKE